MTKTKIAYIWTVDILLLAGIGYTLGWGPVIPLTILTFFANLTVMERTK